MPAKKKSKTHPKRSDERRLGVWIVGMGGGLATTLIAGARLIARGLSEPTGLVTESPELADQGMPRLDDLVFGGHDIRPIDVVENAYQIHRETGTIPLEPLQEIREDLEAAQKNFRPGTVVNCGTAISKLASRKTRSDRTPLAEVLKSIVTDLQDFKKRENLREVVVVNVASTEPPLDESKEHRSMAGLRRLVKEDRRESLRASTLYTLAALDCGFPFINFTPSNAALLPGHLKLALKKGVPLMGNDGKTGETLVKSALAPMFKHRNFRVLTWQGYNILGDGDGKILADRENKAAKITTKDGLLGQILGYPLHTHVAIDYVPSLNDHKTAWDFVHFEGFLGHKMSLQFTWQGCDSILAAPILLDMIRLSDLAKRRGESGLMPHLACFFKNPLGVSEHDLHKQAESLRSYLDG